MAINPSPERRQQRRAAGVAVFAWIGAVSGFFIGLFVGFFSYEPGPEEVFFSFGPIPDMVAGAFFGLLFGALAGALIGAMRR